MGFCEEKLKEITLTNKALFSTMCVLAHIDDASVIDILKEANTIAQSGSVFCFSEPWGVRSHSHCWNVRPQHWWEENLPEWNLDFKTDYILGHEQYKGFVGVKQ